MQLTKKSYQLIDVDGPWLFISMPHDEALRIHLWIKRMYPSAEENNTLAIECEKAIKTAFDTQGLQYDTEKFGDVKMENLRLAFEGDGISMPEAAFIVAPACIKRVKNPLASL